MKLVWSELAKQELIELRSFSINRWGTTVARRYIEDVRDVAKRIAADSRRARPLRGKFHIVRVRSHYLIVAIDHAADRFTIARLLHVAMDIERHLP